MEGAAPPQRRGRLEAGPGVWMFVGGGWPGDRLCGTGALAAVKVVRPECHQLLSFLSCFCKLVYKQVRQGWDWITGRRL